MSKDTSWGAIANWYDDMVEDTTDSFQRNVLLPNLIRLVEPKSGMRILDVACGQGYFARAFAKNGADVIGCDISEELIKLAKGHEGCVEYFVAASDKMSFISDASIDVVVIILALQNIERFVETIRECSRTLKIGGRLIFVLNHPAFRVPKNSSWRWEEKTSLQSKVESPRSEGQDQAMKMYRRVDSYMSEAKIQMDMTPREKVNADKKFTISFHRPLQSYFKALNKSGFAVTRLEEWISHKKSESGPRSAEEDRMRKEIPMFLMVGAKKG